MGAINERGYHEATDFTRTSLGGGGMLRAPRPEPFKTCRGLGRTRLPEPEDLPDAPFASVLLDAKAGQGADLDIEGLARLFALSHAVTAETLAGGGRFYLRSVPSAGALYPCELYLAASGVRGLGHGVFHHRILVRELVELRSGNFAGYIARALGLKGGPPGLVFIVTTIFHRSAWKYGDRAFRYCCLDAGHLAEALVLAARSLGLDAAVHELFDADAVNGLIGVDAAREAAILAVSVDTRAAGEGGAPQGEASSDAGSSEGSEHPAISAVYRASLGGPGKAGEESRIQAPDLGLAPASARLLPEAVAGGTRPFAETVYSRRSGRRYTGGIDESKAKDMLALLKGLPDRAVRLGLVTGGAGALAHGFHLLDLERGETALVRQGDFRSEMAEACLGQRFIAGGSLDFVMLTDLAALEARFGPGGYRRALIESGRAGYRIYLAATALGLSACGVGAFFDHEVRDLLGLACTSRMLYLIASG